MHLIHPIDEATCQEHVGKHVCVVLVDGTHIYGKLGGLSEGKLLLNSCFEGEGEVSTNSVKAKQQLAKKAKTSGFGYPGYYRPGGFALDLALIALLFAIPFFFWY